MTCRSPITVTLTDGEAFHTGRPLYRVECATHGLIHPGTTGPDHHGESHRRTGEAWPIDRPAPTPTPAPGLDLDAVEWAERAMTPGEWRADFTYVTAAGGPVATCIGPDAEHDAAGIVALRNAAPALIAEVRALRAAADEREADMHMRIRAGYDKTVADAWRAEVAKRDAEIADLRALVESQRRDYLDVCDAIAPETSGPADAAAKVRALRAKLAEAKRLGRDACELAKAYADDAREYGGDTAAADAIAAALEAL